MQKEKMRWLVGFGVIASSAHEGARGVRDDRLASRAVEESNFRLAVAREEGRLKAGAWNSVEASKAADDGNPWRGLGSICCGGNGTVVRRSIWLKRDSAIWELELAWAALRTQMACKPVMRKSGQSGIRRAGKLASHSSPRLGRKIFTRIWGSGSWSCSDFS